MDNSGLVVLLEQDQYDDLARMYSLFKRLDEGLNMIRTIMGEHLKSAGSALVQDPESTKDPVDFVQRLLAMKDKYDKYVCAIRMVPSPHAGAGCLIQFGVHCLEGILAVLCMMHTAATLVHSAATLVHSKVAVKLRMCTG